MEDLEIHECSIFEQESFTVSCFALDERQGVLAVARRADFGDEKREAVIELWNVIGTPIFHIRTIPLGKKVAESLLWIDDVLLSAHLDGSICGNRLHSQNSFIVRLTPSPIWCLSAVAERELCAGLDSGAVLLLSLQNNESLVMTKTISVGFGTHVMSIASDGEVIAAGTMDEIFLIDIKKTLIYQTLKLPRTDEKNPTIVWSLCFIRKMLAAGDSRGFITFWNRKTGAFSQSLQTHQADVLSLAVTDNALYAAGVDPTITRLAPDKDGTTFRVEHRRSIHNNDVRCLAASKHSGVLYSGGAECYFCVSYGTKHFDALKEIKCKVASNGEFFLYQYTDRVILWSVACAGKTVRNNFYTLLKEPVKVASVRSQLSQYIISSALNASGDMIAISTSLSTTIYAFNESTAPDTLRKVFIQRRINKPASLLLFTSESLILCSESFKLSTLSLTDIATSDCESLAERNGGGIVVRLHCNENGDMAALTTRNEIFVIHANGKTLHKMEVRGSNVFMDVKFISSSNVYILCADLERTILEYNINERVLVGNPLSSKILMFANESVVQMDCDSSGCIVLVGSQDGFRIIANKNRKRTLLYSEKARSLKYEANGMATEHRDRCSDARWVCATKLLFTTPIMLAEPSSQTAFRLKRFGQN